jgi:hypothetical protein
LPRVVVLEPLGLSSGFAAANLKLRFDLASGEHNQTEAPTLESNASFSGEEPPYLNLAIGKLSAGWPPPEGDRVTATVTYTDMRRDCLPSANDDR